MPDIYAVGETILDIIFREDQPQTAKPGGSSFNASITLGRLGAPITFISEMGNDQVGDLILRFMKENGVDTHCVARYIEGQSAISLAFLNDRSDAEYMFYKDYPFQRLAVEFPNFEENDLLLAGSYYALNPGIRPRVKELLERAVTAGAILLYDPNFRRNHVPDRDGLIPVIRENLAFATLVRASDEDLLHIFETKNPDDAWEQIRPHCGILVYTANAQSVHLRTETAKLEIEVERIEPVSTIGAGDTFNAALAFGIWKNGYSKEQLSCLKASAWEDLIGDAITFSREVCLSYENYLPREMADRVRKKNPAYK